MMTDSEINLSLAIAIGWPSFTVIPRGSRVLVPDERPGQAGKSRLFDYREPEVIWEIARHYDAFPKSMRTGRASRSGLHWRAFAFHRRELIRDHETPEGATALAVIAFAAYLKRSAVSRRQFNRFLVE